MRSAAALAAACLWIPALAGAATVQTFRFDSDPIAGEEDQDFIPDVTLRFSFDETCDVSSCELEILLTYHDSGGLGTVGQALSGVRFDAFSGVTPVDLLVDLGASTVTAQALVGAGADDALADFSAASNSDVDVSGHWGFASGLPGPGGSNLLSSVGDTLPLVGVLGSMDLFAGIISGVEPFPPNGTAFSIVDDLTCTGPPGTPTCGGLAGGFQDPLGRAWIQNEATAILDYDGSGGALTGIGSVDPVFGTDGNTLVPEPGTATLLGLGLLGLGAAGRRPRPPHGSPGGLRSR